MINKPIIDVGTGAFHAEEIAGIAVVPRSPTGCQCVVTLKNGVSHVVAEDYNQTINAFSSIPHRVRDDGIVAWRNALRD